MRDCTEATDGDLARAVADRASGVSDEAEAEIYRRFATRVRLYGLRHLREEDAARDLVQDVLLLVIEKLREGSVREPDRIGSFILGTCRMLADGRRRTERRREHLRTAYLTAPVVEPDEEAGGMELDRVESCMRRLAERERMVVLLTFYAEQPSDVVARTLGTSPGNVRVIRHRALERLRTCVTSRETVQ